MLFAIFDFMTRKCSCVLILVFAFISCYSQRNNSVTEGGLNKEVDYTSDNDLNKKFFFKIYPLYSIINRHSVGFEYFYKTTRSIEFQPVFLFKSPNLNGEFQKNISNVIFLRKGIELFVGINFLKPKTSRVVLNGIYFSYKYVHISNERYSYYPDRSYSFVAYGYRFSQTRNQFSINYRRSVIRTMKRASFELYAMIGLSAGYSRNTVFYFSDLSGASHYPLKQMSMEGLSYCNGAYAYPEIKLGFYPRFRLN